MNRSANLLDQDGTSPKDAAPERDDGSAAPPQADGGPRGDRFARAWPLLLLCLGAVASVLWTGLLVWSGIALLRWFLE